MERNRADGIQIFRPGERVSDYTRDKGRADVLCSDVLQAVRREDYHECQNERNDEDDAVEQSGLMSGWSSEVL